jgi:dTDP-4-dehydrorhamnose 3,5-epimerase
LIFEAVTAVAGAFVIRPRRFEDDRGHFARLFCVRELAEHGLDAEVVQRSVSYNKRRGTLRGMHYQAEPYGENKIVSCRRGALFDVAVDLRPGSPTFKRWFGVTLAAEDETSFFIPRGCAHGFVTLADDTTVDYAISTFHHAEAARGVRWNDPAFGIDWPLAPVVMADRDRNYPDFAGG